MRLLRWGICALLAFAVLAFAGNPAWAQLTLESGAAALLVVWVFGEIRRAKCDVRVPWIFLPLGLLLLLGTAQSVFGFSAYGHATNLELAQEFACLLIAFLWVQAFRSFEARTQFAWYLLALAFAVSLFAIVQHFTWNGKLYWMFKVAPGGYPFGPYVDSDHFAGFVELTTPLGIAEVFAGTIERDRIPLLLVLIVVPMGALALTTSRAGTAGLLVEIAFLAALMFRRRFPVAGMADRPRIRVAGLAATALVFASWLGVAPLLSRIRASTPTELSHERRIALYRDSIRIFLEHPLAGTGPGTFREVYPEQESYWDGRVVVHAHSEYLELLVESGIAGGLCGAIFLFLLFRMGWQQAKLAGARAGALHAGALAACLGLLVHDLVDFNLRVPANALIFIILASMATSSSDAQIADDN